MKKKRVFIFLGKPGSGKGTQAEMLSKKLKLPSIATGEILRNMKKQKTPLAKLIRERIDKGKFVPDTLILEILEKQLKKSDCRKGYILDGFPRTLFQAKKFRQNIDRVFYIDVSNSTIIRRLSSRRECSCGMTYNMITNPPKKDELCDKCGKKLYRREDDKPETIRKRLRIYAMQTRPLIEFYRKKGILEKVDGEKEIKKIFSDITKLLSK